MQKTAYDPAWANAEKLAVATLAAKEVIADTKPAGIQPEMLERCLRLKARPKKGVDAPKSADDWVLLEKETNKLRERCVRTAINSKQQKKAAAKK